MRGFGNNILLLNTSRFLGAATVKGFVIRCPHYVPMAIRTVSKGHFIEGEVYEVDHDTLRYIDLLEGYNEDWPDDYCMYKRIKALSEEFGEVEMYVSPRQPMTDEEIQKDKNIISYPSWRQYILSKQDE